MNTTLTLPPATRETPFPLAWALLWSWQWTDFVESEGRTVLHDADVADAYDHAIVAGGAVELCVEALMDGALAHSPDVAFSRQDAIRAHLRGSIRLVSP